MLRMIKKVSIAITLSIVFCSSLRAEDYHLMFCHTEDGGFKFFVMQSSKSGYLQGFFRKNTHPFLPPKSELSGTTIAYLHHFFQSDGIVTFAIQELYFKIESDRTVFLWGGAEEDRIWVYIDGKLKGLRLDCRNVKGTVFYRVNGQKFRPNVDKCDIFLTKKGLQICGYPKDVKKK